MKEEELKLFVMINRIGKKNAISLRPKMLQMSNFEVVLVLMWLIYDSKL